MMERGVDTASAGVHLDPGTWYSLEYRVLVMTPPLPPMSTPVREGETIEGSRTMRNRPYLGQCNSANKQRLLGRSVGGFHSIHSEQIWYC